MCNLRYRAWVWAWALVCGLTGLGIACMPLRAADPANLPPEVREGLAGVDLDWSDARRLLQDAAEASPDQVDASPLWAGFFAELLLQGGVSAGEWGQHLEQRRLDIEGVCAIWRRLRFEDPEGSEQMGITRAFWEAITALFPPGERDPATLPFDQVLTLGEIRFWAGDIEGAKQMYEDLLKRLPEGPTDGQACRGLMAYRIAQCLERDFDIRGALEWYLKCAEWGSPEQTGGSDVRAEGLVEAARMCRSLGRYVEADLYYRRALNQCSGWGQAIAALDLARILINEGKEEEGESFLRSALDVCGGGWGGGKILMRLARRSYARGEREAALEHCRGVMQELTGSVWPPAARLADVAADMVDRIHRWDTTPMEVSTDSIRLQAGKAEQFVVTTWLEPPLDATTTMQCIGVRLADRSTAKPGEVSRKFDVSLKADTEPGTYEGEIVLTGPGARPVEIPVNAVVPTP